MNFDFDERETNVYILSNNIEYRNRRRIIDIIRNRSLKCYNTCNV